MSCLIVGHRDRTKTYRAKDVSDGIREVLTCVVKSYECFKKKMEH